ncbi:hypothetical protein APHAL10511_007559 [Amanita phalloides]|nr:hypothetical protein APHAL10511_007559 [Amanita phalloides]
MEPHQDPYDHLDDEVKQLQPFAESLVFGKTNWVYFLRNQDGKRSLTYRKKLRRPIQHPLFSVQAVHESELTYVRPISGCLVEVDAWIGINDLALSLIEKRLRGYELLRGLDLTFEILAHTVDSNGNISGLLFEPSFGRPFQASDIIALNDAMCRIHERDLFWALDPENIMLSHDNKIRILSYCGVRKFRSAEERENHRLKVQKTLHEIFLDYKDLHHLYSSHRYEHICPEFMDGTPPIEFPITIFTALRSCAKMEFYSFSDDSNTPLSTDKLKYRGRRRTPAALPLADTTRIEEVSNNSGVNGEEDKPFLRTDRRRRCRRASSARPYQLSARKPRNFLLAPE